MIDRSQSTQEQDISRGWVSLRMAISGVCLFACLLLGVFLFLNTPPARHAESSLVVTEGMTFAAIAEELKAAGVVRSAMLLTFYARLTDTAHRIQIGEYRFSSAMSAWEVTRSLRSGSAHVPPVVLTIPEGSTLQDIDAIVHAQLPRIPSGAIAAAAKEKEGVLFPDTYFISTTASAEDIVMLLQATFAEKLLERQETIQASGFSETEIIVLASLVEKEGNDEESMRTIAGILLSRLAIDMPLQVDATYAYALGKTSAELTEEELRADSPWNTYTKRGLPPSPIGSPGLMAIDAVLNPIKTDYLYYLSDADGVFHYARTFDEHKENKALYLQ